jgi:hypothetical protein
MTPLIPPIQLPIFTIIFFALLGGGYLVIGKPKAIGYMPYRYGHFVGICHGVLAIFALAIAVKTRQDSILMSTVILVGLVCASISIGLLRRKRFGVILFFGIQTLLLIQFSILAYRSSTQPGYYVAIADFLALFATTQYFEKRWKFMVPEYAAQAEPQKPI